ncbi:UNVERIFIED_CONTAM: hypothetical protein HDU68_005200 [Siphonaria sp. JEL0065]|nr:hypothetical protein HDU68_005200 [Siphonaria sp. JEL0065]
MMKYFRSVPEYGICIDSRTYGKFEIGTTPSNSKAVGIDFHTGTWAVPQYIDIRNPTLSQRKVEPTDITVKTNAANMTYSCIENIDPTSGLWVQVSKSMVIPPELFQVSDAGILAFDYFVQNPEINFEDDFSLIGAQYANFTFYNQNEIMLSQIQNLGENKTYYNTDEGISSYKIRAPANTRTIKIEIFGTVHPSRNYSVADSKNSTQFCLERFGAEADVRIAAVLGFMATVNVAVLRVSLQYLQSNPTDNAWFSVLYHSLEIIVYTAMVVYFISMIVRPGWIDDKLEFRRFRNVAHVKALVHKFPTFKGPSSSESLSEEEPEERGFVGAVKKLWGEKKDERYQWMQEKEEKLHILGAIQGMFDVPARLLAVYFMVTLFTYTYFIVYGNFLYPETVFGNRNKHRFLSHVFDSSPEISCAIGNSTTDIQEALSIILNLIALLLGKSENPDEEMQKANELVTQIQIGVDFIKKVINATAVVACGLTALILLYNVVDLAAVYKRNLASLQRGDYTFMTKSERSEVSSSKASKFMGIQVGYAFIGSFYTLLLMQISCFVVACFLASPDIRKYVWEFFSARLFLFVAIIIAVVLDSLQEWIVDKLFVVHYTVGPNNQKHTTGFWLSNLNKYDQLDYFFLFPNLIGGLFDFIAQCAKSAIGSAIFAYRVDKHPILEVACNLLLQAVKTEQEPPRKSIFRQYHSVPYQDLERGKLDKSVRRNRFRNRWFLALTLTRNPSLQAFRKHCVQQTLMDHWSAKTEAVRAREEALKTFEHNQETNQNTKPLK